MVGHARTCGRATIGAMVLILAAGLARAAEGDAEAVVKAKLEALKAQGVPVSYGELVPKPVPDAENGAKLYIQAADILNQRDPDPNEGPGVHRYDPADWNDPVRRAVVAALVDHDGDALGLVKMAAAKPYAWFNLDWSNPPATMFPHLAKMRALSRFVGSAAVVAAERGDQAEALDDLRVGFVMGRHISPEPTIIDQLVSYAIDGVVTNAAWRVIGRGPMPEKEAQALAEELSRAGYQEGLDRAVKLERCFGIWAFDQLREHADEAAGWLADAGFGAEKESEAWWVAYGKQRRAATYADESIYLEQLDRKAALAALPWREAAGKAATDGLDAVPEWAKLSRIAVAGIGPIGMRRDQAIAMRALVGAALGIELYKQKAGSYPATLAEVEQGGWKVAGDPFSGEALKYKKVGDTYLLYSVGPDLKDDGGKPIASQLGEMGREMGDVRQEDRDKGDLVWMGTWAAAERAGGG